MTTASHQLHRHLIGVSCSRDQLNTPCLILDLDAFEANVAAMAAFGRKHGVAIRPHAKTHKSADIARAQVAAGAVGQCCAKLGEGEALADGGIEYLHLTSPVVTAPGMKRLVALHARTSGLSVVADHPSAVDMIAAANHGDRPLTMFVDVDPGSHRTGVASPDAAVALARRIVERNSLHYGGVQFYCGTEQHIASYGERRRAIVERTAYLKLVVDALREAGLPPPTITGGGTGSHVIDAELGVLTELQVGSYVFMDREYGACDLDGSGGAAFATALMVDARVISANADSFVTIDAGLKAFSTEAGPPPVIAGMPAGTAYTFMGDEHGALTPLDGRKLPPLGARITLGTPHCDPTVNLYDAYHVVRGTTLIAIWPVSARGRSA